MNIRETLKEIRDLITKRDTKQAYIDRLMMSATNISPVLDGMPHGGGGSTTKIEHYSVECADKESELNDIKQQLELYSKDVKREIERVKDERYRDALKLRYIECMSVKEVAECMHYDRKSMYRILWQAEYSMIDKTCDTMRHYATRDM